MGDIASLARSIADVGPFASHRGEAGGRRLAAFRQLQRSEIPVTMV